MLNNIITRKFVGLIIRHAMTALGGWLLAEGYTDEETWATISGGAVAVGGLGLSVIEKRFRF